MNGSEIIIIILGCYSIFSTFVIIILLWVITMISTKPKNEVKGGNLEND